jgi:hypothetical protein
LEGGVIGVGAGGCFFAVVWGGSTDFLESGDDVAGFVGGGLERVLGGFGDEVFVDAFDFTHFGIYYNGLVKLKGRKNVDKQFLN